MQMLSAHDQVFVNDLSKEFGVSEVTIRNDLEQLEMKKTFSSCTWWSYEYKSDSKL